MTPALPLIAAALLMGTGAAALAAPVISPFAADLLAGSYSSNRTAGGSAESAFNGGYWNAGGHGTYWVQADMGASFTLSQVRLTVDVLPANVTWQQVFLSDSPIGDLWSTLTAVASRTGYTSKYEQFELDFASPASGRYLQVVSNGGGSWTALGDEFQRGNWVDPAPQGTSPAPSNVPEPAGWALSAFALLALGAQRRQQRAG